MILSDLRAFVRAKLKSGNSTIRYTDYPSIFADTGVGAPGDIDYAILLIGNDFVDRTKCTRKTSTAAFTLGATTVDISGITLFRPEFLIESRSIFISSDANFSASDVRCGFERGGLQDIANKAACVGTSNGTPHHIAFMPGNLQAVVERPFKAAGTMNFIWTPPFIPALADIPTATTAVNIPDDLLMQIIERMAVEVQINEIEPMERDSKIAAYEATVLRCMGKGNLGQNVLIRESVDMRRW